MHIFGACENRSKIRQKSDEEFLSYVLRILEQALLDNNGFGSTCVERTVFHRNEDQEAITSAFQALKLGKEVKP